jgi:hypothetical protein
LVLFFLARRLLLAPLALLGVILSRGSNPTPVRIEAPFCHRARALSVQHAECLKLSHGTGDRRIIYADLSRQLALVQALEGLVTEMRRQNEEHAQGRSVLDLSCDFCSRILKQCEKHLPVCLCWGAIFSDGYSGAVNRYERDNLAGTHSASSLASVLRGCRRFPRVCRMAALKPA